MRSNLSLVVLRTSDDSVKTDLELTCSLCGKCLCDAEAGDSIEVLASVATDHLVSKHPRGDSA